MSCFYYTQDKKIFLSKIEALSYSQKSNQKLFFHYYDDVYDKCNWLIEPPESIDYYYKEQAQRIRDNYDYIILCYSGGYDSHNILETFYYNNIKIDKIVTIGALKQDSQSGVDENHNGELYHNVFPNVKELNLESITQVYDYTDLFGNINNFSIVEYGTDWINHTGSWYSPHNWFWMDIHKRIVPKKWGDKKVAIVMGRDKPTLFLNHSLNKLGFFFRDTPITSYGNLKGDEQSHIINFYWDPTIPEILIKQLHMIYHVYRNNPIIDYNKAVGVNTYNGIDVNDIIYNIKKPLIFKSPKSKNNYFSLRDEYLKHKQNSDLYKIYSDGISLIDKTVELKNLVAIQSKFYGMFDV